MHVVTNPVWFDSKNELFTHADKSLMIIYPDDSQQLVHLRIIIADPNGANAGKYSVMVWQSWPEEVSFTPVSTQIPPPVSQIQVWERYLDGYAVSRIKNAKKEDFYGSDCVLQLVD